MKYVEIIETLNYIYSLDQSFKDNLTVAGGIAPYISIGVKSNRLHSDIDFICNINHIDKVRNVLINNDFYRKEMDSKFYFDKDYGFECIINNIKVGFYPYDNENAIHQYSYNSNNKDCKIRRLNIDINEYINNSVPYKVMSLEVILKSKIKDFREKDKDEINLICEYGFDNKFYKKIEIEKI